MDQAQQLRNVIKLKNQNNTPPARVMTITSGKGGVGKSTYDEKPKTGGEEWENRI